jgi:hypothetical protein
MLQTFQAPMLWIATNPTWIAAIASLLLAVLTGVYVVLTLAIVKQAREANVIAQVIPDENHFNVMNLELVNAGPSTARAVTAKFEPNVQLKSGIHLSDLFGHVPVLSAGQRIRTVLFAATDKAYIDKEYPTRELKVQLSWRDGSTVRIRRRDTVERIDRYFGACVVGPSNSMEEAVNDLADLAKILVEERRHLEPRGI